MLTVGLKQSKCWFVVKCSNVAQRTLKTKNKGTFEWNSHKLIWMEVTKWSRFSLQNDCCLVNRCSLRIVCVFMLAFTMWCAFKCFSDFPVMGLRSSGNIQSIFVFLSDLGFGELVIEFVCTMEDCILTKTWWLVKAKIRRTFWLWPDFLENLVSVHEY